MDEDRTPEERQLLALAARSAGGMLWMQHPAPGVTPPAYERAQRLESANLLARILDPANPRIVCWKITEAGKRTVGPVEVFVVR